MKTLRDMNRIRIAEELRRHGEGSRGDLVSWTGLSRSTVAAVVADLQSRGVVLERVDGGARYQGRGRPPGQLRLNPSVGAVIGVDFGHRHVRVALADLFLTVLAERAAQVDVDTQASVALDLAAELVEQTLAEAGVDRSRVVATGMGLPGPIDTDTGTVGQSVVLPSWAGREAGRELEQRIGIEVRLDNDANLGALAEVFFGAGRDLENVVYVKVSSGIGAGLVLDGKIYHGQTGIAGELGHVHVKADGAVCRCGNRGCLETVASTGALVALLASSYDLELTLADLLDLVESGDLGARRVIRDAGRAVGEALADVCNILNPAAVIIGGDLSRAGEPLLSGIQESIDRYAQPGAAQAVKLMIGALGPRAEVLGAIALVSSNADARSALAAAGSA
jgi:predicted NBD/HSP70 family sugar kinase